VCACVRSCVCVERMLVCVYPPPQTLLAVSSFFCLFVSPFFDYSSRSVVVFFLPFRRGSFSLFRFPQLPVYIGLCYVPNPIRSQIPIGKHTLTTRHARYGTAKREKEKKEKKKVVVQANLGGPSCFSNTLSNPQTFNMAMSQYRKTTPLVLLSSPLSGAPGWPNPKLNSGWATTGSGWACGT
jgi:hypothetical protein